MLHFARLVITRKRWFSLLWLLESDGLHLSSQLCLTKCNSHINSFAWNKIEMKFNFFQSLWTWFRILRKLLQADWTIQCTRLRLVRCAVRSPSSTFRRCASEADREHHRAGGEVVPRAGGGVISSGPPPQNCDKRVESRHLRRRHLSHHLKLIFTPLERPREAGS